MRKSRFADAQIVAIFREADKTTVAAAAKQKRVSEASIYGWRQHFNGMEPSDVKKVKALEFENGEFMKWLAERDLVIDLMREVNRRKW